MKSALVQNIICAILYICQTLKCFWRMFRFYSANK